MTFLTCTTRELKVYYIRAVSAKNDASALIDITRGVYPRVREMVDIVSVFFDQPVRCLSGGFVVDSHDHIEFAQ